MNRTITLLTLVFVCAWCARADVAAVTGFTTGTSFENQTTGPFDPALDDKGKDTGKTSWKSADTNGMTVAEYGADEAYDYEAKGTKRNTLFDDEPEEGTPGTNAKYLALSVEDPLERCVMPVEGSSVSNVAVNGGVYCDTLVRFTTSYSAPAITNIDKIAVWLRERELDGGKADTNLMITAGYYAGGFDKVAAKDYVLTNVAAEGAWCRLTVCAMTNVTTHALRRVPGFTVYIDGKPAAYEGASGEIGADYREDLLTPESRVLKNERRLFPWLVSGDKDIARSLSRFAFAGYGAADDVSFSSERPDYVVADNVFTLRWDAGVTSMRCVVSNATAVVTNDIDAAANAQRRCDFALGANNYARVTVTKVVYDAAHEYTNGIWKAENDCTLTDAAETSGTFVYDGESKNPIGCVYSSRPYIGVGAGGADGSNGTFKQAKALAKERGTKTLVLMTDLVITAGEQSDEFKDNGAFSIGIDDDLILDLAGHTLQGLGLGGNATIEQNGGKLEIVDSVGGGVVLPPTNGTVAVQSFQSDSSVCPLLVIGAGRFDGEVCITGKPADKKGHSALCAKCAIGGGSFTNVFDETQGFYLEQYVTNTTAYYALDDGDNCWSVAATDAFIWSGAGKDAKWTTAGNWKCGKVPGVDGLAIFPRTNETWTVDFGTGVAAKRLWMDADVAMSGANVFSDVKVESGEGRFVGTGTMVFTNALPGCLTGDTGSGEVRIGAGWKGTVKMAKVSSPKLLADIDSWGVAGSKVEFAGVRGYVSDKSTHTLPYGLVLTDDGDTPAWKNETGYTGSTVSFPSLTGSGTFDSPKNLREIGQVFQFGDVSGFKGKFKIGGKKLLLGEGSAASGSSAGSFTFADSVRVSSGLDWSGVSAYFGETLDVDGALGETLMTYSGGAPSVGHVVVTLYDRTTGAMTTNALNAADGKVTVVVMPVVDGKFTLASDLDDKLKAGSVLEIPAGAAVATVGGRKSVNGYILPDYYKLTKPKALTLSASEYLVAFDETKATPALADFEVSSDAGRVVVTATNTKPGLWYGLRAVSSLAESFDGAETVWLQAEDTTVTFDVETSGDSSFYQVIVSDRDPLAD